MCIATPAQVLQVQGLQALCSSRYGTTQVDLSLTGEVPVGAWVLVFQDAARQVIDQEQAHQIERALDALREVSLGGTDIDAFFPDLASREPQLPEHLRVKDSHE